MRKKEPLRPFDKHPGERRRDWWQRNWRKMAAALGVAATILTPLAALSRISGFTGRDLLSPEVPTATLTATPTATPVPTATSVPTVTSTSTITPTPWPFEPAGKDEVLVIVTDFDQRGDIIADNRIYRALRERVAESGLERARVERLKGVMPLAAEEAIAVGEQYRATIVIWGTADNVAFEPRYEVITHSDLIRYRMELEPTIATADNASFNARIAQEAPLEFEYLMLFSLGQVAHYSREYEEAVVLFSLALDLLPGFSYTDSLNPEVVYVYRGLAYDAQGEYEAAIGDYSRAIELSPEYADAYNDRGIARVAQGDLEGAIADFSRAIELNPEFALAYNNRGNARGARGDLEGAIADYGRAIDIDPEFAIVYNNRGLVYHEQGEYEAAIADYSRAIDIDPEFAIAYNNRGNARSARGDLEGAIADYSRAIEFNPEFAIAYYNRGRVYDEQGEYGAAIADYSRAIELDPEFAWAYYNRGNARKAQGDLEGAIADYSRAIGIDPELADAYYGRALIYDGQGNVEAALADYIRFLELSDTEDRYTAYARERIEALRSE